MSQIQPAALPSRNLLLAVSITAIALFAGAVGFHATNGTGWLDSTMDASLTFNGMGPQHAIRNEAATVFITIYSLLGGLAYLSTVGILPAPVARRIMHGLHLDMYGEETDNPSAVVGRVAPPMNPVTHTRVLR